MCAREEISLTLSPHVGPKHLGRRTTSLSLTNMETSEVSTHSPLFGFGTCVEAE